MTGILYREGRQDDTWMAGARVDLPNKAGGSAYRDVPHDDRGVAVFPRAREDALLLWRGS